MLTLFVKIIINKNIFKGDRIKIEDIELKRSAHGIEGSKLDKILNKKLINDLKKDSPLSFKDIE